MKSDAIKRMLNPMPREFIRLPGELALSQNPVRLAVANASGDALGDASCDQMVEHLQRCLAMPVNLVADAKGATDATIRMQILPGLGWSDALEPEQRIEAHEIIITTQHVSVIAMHGQGLLRAVATLGQLSRQLEHLGSLPCATIRDWPMIRHRCAADMLVNVEVNRWACDRGDGQEAFVTRVIRKLDFCFDHKINRVWFDGFGWDVNRFPDYVKLMRQFNDAARQRGIQLIFGGYGGGYGTAYQLGEIYRSGYMGRVFKNQTDEPNVQDYPCRGMPDPRSRYYGTCLSNEKMRRLKIQEMLTFVTQVRPGCMYIHDIDVETWDASHASWLLRCDQCRKRWPSDVMQDAAGQAGACATWFKQIRTAMNALPEVDGYLPGRDLAITFASPMYTNYRETGHNVWEYEMQYFETLGKQIGPLPGISFGVREQFDDVQGTKRMASLRKRMDQNGCGHGIHALVFGGGDTFRSDDLTNTVAATSHYYEGATSVYLSGTGIHSDPIQMLNADGLWSGSVRGYKDKPPKETSSVKWFDQVCYGTRKPAEIFAPGKDSASVFEQLCVQRWGVQAGPLMSQSLQSRSLGRNPVAYIWWSITNPVYAMYSESVDALYHFHEKHWRCRVKATDAALVLAKQAALISDDEDVHWLARCLDLGKRYAMAIQQLIRVASGRVLAEDEFLTQILLDLRQIITSDFEHQPVDVLGGDPGCWLPTLDTLQQLADRYKRKRMSATDVTSDFLDTWHVDQNCRVWPNALCELSDEFTDRQRVDLSCTVQCNQAMPLSLLLTYDSPLHVSIDGNEIWSDPNVSQLKQVTSPVSHDAAVIPWTADAGRHQLTIHCQPDANGYASFSARFQNHDGSQKDMPQILDHE